MKYEIGKKIRKYREAQNLTQKEFANLVGVSNARVSNWEQGLNRPDVDLLAIICTVLKVSPNELLDIEIKTELTADEKELLYAYKKLNSEGKKEAVKRVNELTQITAYTFSAQPSAEEAI